MVSGSQPICVIIAAKNASDTIDIAIRSALAEPEVGEVVVIDDGSTDTTSDVAHAADDGTGRLRVVRFDVNRGPSAASNPFQARPPCSRPASSPRRGFCR